MLTKFLFYRNLKATKGEELAEQQQQANGQNKQLLLKNLLNNLDGNPSRELRFVHGRDTSENTNTEDDLNLEGDNSEDEFYGDDNEDDEDDENVLGTRFVHGRSVLSDDNNSELDAE